MKRQSPDKKEVLAMAGALVATSALFQAVRGGGLADFSLRLLFSSVAVVFVWRIRRLVGAAYLEENGRPGRRFLLHVLFWIVAAVALFFGFRHFR